MELGIDKKLPYYCNSLIDCLIVIDNHSLHFGDYCAYGCECVLNGVYINNEYSLGEILEDTYDNIFKHYIDFRNHWDTFLFYSPSDIRGFIFDFSFLSEGKVICYNGLHGMNSLTKVCEYNIEQFLNNYGVHKFMSITHYKVSWPHLGINWNN